MSDMRLIEGEEWYRAQHAEIVNLRIEVERLRAALKRIVDEADSDAGLTIWDGGDIARRALEQKAGTE